MPYATVDQMVVRFGEPVLIQLSDPEAQALQADAIGEALADASGVMDSYLARRYSLPLSASAAVLVDCCADLALYRLMRLRPASATEDAKERADAAMDWLKDVGSGRAVIQELEAPASMPGGSVQVSSSRRLFSREGLHGY